MPSPVVRVRGAAVGCPTCATCVLAGNPSPMTLDGTNTWVLSAPGATQCVVVDPGPDDSAHRRAVLAEVAARSMRVAVVLLTHGHPDHAAGAGAFAAAAGVDGRAPGVRALDPAVRLGSEDSSTGTSWPKPGSRSRWSQHPGTRLTPVVPAARAGTAAPDLLTGDTVLGRGSSVVAFPEGRLGAYLESLDRLSVVV